MLAPPCAAPPCAAPPCAAPPCAAPPCAAPPCAAPPCAAPPCAAPPCAAPPCAAPPCAAPPCAAPPCAAPPVAAPDSPALAAPAPDSPPAGVPARPPLAATASPPLPLVLTPPLPPPPWAPSAEKVEPPHATSHRRVLRANPESRIGSRIPLPAPAGGGPARKVRPRAPILAKPRRKKKAARRLVRHATFPRSHGEISRGSSSSATHRSTARSQSNHSPERRLLERC